VPTTRLTLSVVNKDEWDTKEGRGKSMKNALHVQQYGKRHLCSNFLKAFKINLKAFLGLVLPNQYCHIIM